MDDYLERERPFTPDLTAADVPADAVTTSASGVDPRHLLRQRPDPGQPRGRRARHVARATSSSWSTTPTSAAAARARRARSSVNVVKLNRGGTDDRPERSMIRVAARVASLASSTRGSWHATRSCSWSRSAQRLTTVIWVRRARDDPGWFTFTVAVWLWLTVLFGNFAEAHRRGPRQGAGRHAARDAHADTSARLRDGSAKRADELHPRRRGRRRGRRGDPGRRHGDRGHRLGRRVGHHRRVGARHPRVGRRPQRGHRRHARPLRPHRRSRSRRSPGSRSSTA